MIVLLVKRMKWQTDASMLLNPPRSRLVRLANKTIKGKIPQFPPFCLVGDLTADCILSSQQVLVLVQHYRLCGHNQNPAAASNFGDGIVIEVKKSQMPIRMIFRHLMLHQNQDLLTAEYSVSC